jgi:signal transduction histidine kinase
VADHRGELTAIVPELPAGDFAALAETLKHVSTADLIDIDAFEERTARLCHDLRTPLNAIVGFAEVMQRADLAPLPRPYRDYAGNIHASGLRMLGVVNGLVGREAGASKRRVAALLAAHRAFKALAPLEARVRELHAQASG